MVAFRSSSAAAVLGAVASQAVSILLPRAASASWGWTLTVPAGAKFACAEGTPIGCAIRDGCNTSNVTCIVQPATGWTCNESSIAVHCILAGGKAFLPYTMDTNGGVCKSSSNNTLFWSAVPTCTNGSSSVTSSSSVSSSSSNSSNSSSSSTSSISGASQAAVSVMGFLSAMLVAGTGLQN
ncbi:unnamed protein product [Polarella glacialis]|uniref:Uncharacterized protein n=1 Tax=Polarella glacialis TaxID=89957 RepID=A0A813HXT1_POLGL|nr:unnamed protein product [Polarella glacialis]CAE8642556.1 unnamed protein product [Polarella glacialis]